MIRAARLGGLVALLIVLAPPLSAGEPRLLDGFETPAHWTVITSDGVTATLSAVAGRHGSALRLDFDFAGGAGYCVIRRQLSLDLPDNYRFALALRGDAPPNNLEFKLIDADHPNVWWNVRRNFDFPADWRILFERKRQVRFAWGPAAGQPLRRIAAIELAISAGAGGKGYVLFDDLTFEPMPVPRPLTRAPRLRFSSAADSAAPPLIVPDPAGRLDWHSAATDQHPTVVADLRHYHEFGGVRLDWDAHDYPRDLDVSVSIDGKRYRTIARVRNAAGKRRYVRLPDAEGRYLKLDVRRASRNRGVGLRGFRVLDVAFGESLNNMFTTIAHDRRRDWTPRYFAGQPRYWTVVGIPQDGDEALVDAAGAVEVGRGAFRIEPMLWADGRLMTSADARITQSLAENYLPIPTVTWRVDGLSLAVTPLAAGAAGRSGVAIRYQIRNDTNRQRQVRLFLAIRPFQVLPPWQNLNITGGVTRITHLTLDARSAIVNAKPVTVWTSADAFGATNFARGEIVEHLAAGTLPTTPSARDADGLASGAWCYDFNLPPASTRYAMVSFPFHTRDELAPASALEPEVAAERFERLLAAGSDEWRKTLGRVTMDVPALPFATKLRDTFRTTQAYILINADGPAMQPGSRTYARSWIRDGAMTSTALLYTRHTQQVRAFADWYAGFQFPSGKVPAVVDDRGADPVDEHDSTGEFIHLLRRTYQFTHDAAFLRAHLPQVIAGVTYIESLRARQTGPDYRDGPPRRRACYGLVPRSISHEGYSAEPMHSYWDDFWVLRGLEDAAAIADTCQRPRLAHRYATLRDTFQHDLYASIRLAMKNHGIDYIPGCVELGDFDATSTAIAVFPGDQLGRAPEPALHNTFERYWRFFCKRRAGELKWDSYTPYEIRLVGTFIRLEQPERARELLRFFFEGQRPAAWNQWAEVVWRDPATPRFIGDMPHTWVGSAYINAVRSMFVYEDERREALLLAAGVPRAWLDVPGGRVRIAAFPTLYGDVSYTLAREGGAYILRFDAAPPNPPGGLVVPEWVTISRAPTSRP